MSQEDTRIPHLVQVLQLADRERRSWPAISAGIPGWHPRNEETGDGDGTGESSGDGEITANAKANADADDAGKKTPPWGTDQDFDPARAWKLVQDLRGDNTTAKAERDALRTKVKEHEDASKSDHEKLTERSQAAETTAKQAQSETARLRVALRKGLTETQAKRLVGDTEEDLDKDADELLASFKVDDTGDAPRRRPREQLRTGAARSSEPDESDPAKLAAQVSRGW